MALAWPYADPALAAYILHAAASASNYPYSPAASLYQAAAYYPHPAAAAAAAAAAATSSGGTPSVGSNPRNSFPVGGHHHHASPGGLRGFPSPASPYSNSPLGRAPPMFPYPPSPPNGSLNNSGRGGSASPNSIIGLNNHNNNGPIKSATPSPTTTIDLGSTSPTNNNNGKTGNAPTLFQPYKESTTTNSGSSNNNASNKD